jgi:hypothetical protein
MAWFALLRFSLVKAGLCFPTVRATNPDISHSFF